MLSGCYLSNEACPRRSHFGSLAAFSLSLTRLCALISCAPRPSPRSSVIVALTCSDDERIDLSADEVGSSVGNVLRRRRKRTCASAGSAKMVGEISRSSDGFLESAPNTPGSTRTCGVGLLRRDESWSAMAHESSAAVRTGRTCGLQRA